MANPLEQAIGFVTEIGSTAYANRLGEKRMHEQMDFTQMMDNSKYQRSVKDLRSAGLNPMLAYGHGASSSPQVSAAPVQKAEVAQTYNQSRIASAQEGNIESDTAKKVAETQNTVEDTNLKVEQKLNIALDSAIKAGIPDVQKAEIALAFSNKELADQRVKESQTAITKTNQEIQNLKTELKNKETDTKLKQQLTLKEQELTTLTAIQHGFVRAQQFATEQENEMRKPKVEAAKTWTGKAAAQADNVKRIMDPINNAVSTAAGAARLLK